MKRVVENSGSRAAGVFRRAWGQSQWPLLLGCLMLDAIKHVVDDNFVSQLEKARCAQQSAVATEQNFRLSFS